jgi:phage/plasmid-associated DNA primase
MIRNVLGQSKAGLISFLQFSKKCLTYDKEDCCKKFSELLQVDNGFTIASGIKWAKDDNKNLYIKFFPLKISLNFSTKQAGTHFHLCYSNKYIFTNGVLYVWNGVYWTKDDKRFTLLIQEITEVWYYTLLKLADSEIDEENRKIFKHIINNLLNSTHRKQFVDDILYALTDNKIQWNKNPTLFVFENCVYDLTTQQVIEPNPKDYCNRSCGYDYREVTAEEIAELHVLLVSIFPNEGIRKHYLEILATGLSAIQIEKLFIATGGGGNGKSLINSLMMMTVGQYGYKVPSSLLTKEIKQGANPEVANLDGIRFALCQEPDAKKPMCASVFKELTGDKTLNCRQLYSNECVIRLNLTLVLEANDLPKLDEINPAVERRIDITPFISTAVSREDFDLAEDKTNLCIADTRYKSDAFQDQYRIVLFHILAKYFAIFVTNGFKMSDPPAEVRAKSKAYMANSDNLYEWFITYYIEDATSSVSMSDVFQKYSECQLQNTTRRIRTNADTKKKLTELFASNLFLSKFLKERGLYFCKQRLSTTAVCGWRIKSDAEIEE